MISAISWDVVGSDTAIPINDTPMVPRVETNPYRGVCPPKAVSSIEGVIISYGCPGVFADIILPSGNSGWVLYAATRFDPFDSADSKLDTVA